MSKNIVIACIVFASVFSACESMQTYKYVKLTIPKGASIAIIIDAKNEVKNTIIAKFMEKGLRVKAVNASDLYTVSDHFLIKDYKKLAYEKSEIVLGSSEDSLNSIQKSYDSIYKLHIYSYEANKAEMLSEMKSKWGIKYIILLEMNDWEHLCWARTIDLDSNEVIGIENYQTKYSDKVGDVIDHFIESLVAM